MNKLVIDRIKKEKKYISGFVIGFNEDLVHQNVMQYIGRQFMIGWLIESFSDAQLIGFVA